MSIPVVQSLERNARNQMARFLDSIACELVLPTKRPKQNGMRQPTACEFELRTSNKKALLFKTTLLWIAASNKTAVARWRRFDHMFLPEVCSPETTPIKDHKHCRNHPQRHISNFS